MISVKETKQLEQQAVQQGVSLEKLMENAGKAVYETVKDKFEIQGKKIVLFCGQGNNGGDGFVAARYFAERCQVVVLFFGDKHKFSEEARLNYEKVKDTVALIEISDKEELVQFKFQKNQDYLLIDALLGTGFRGEIREPLSSAIDLFNSLQGIKVAVDLPSGMDGDTGERADKSCGFDLIVCFHDLKKGLAEYRKDTVVVDIGLPEEGVKINKC